MFRILKPPFRTAIPGLLFASSFCFAIALAASVTATTLQDTESQVDCLAIAAPEIIETKTGTVEVAVELSEPVGQVDSARLDPDSGISVQAIESDDATHLVLELDVSAAQTGSWDFTLVGDSGLCSGSLEIESRAA